MNGANARRSESAWPADRVAELMRLFVDEGLTCAAIGKLMRISKSTVIGKVHRLGLERGAAFVPSAAQVGRIRAEEIRHPPSTIFSRLAELDVFPAAGHCVFPTGSLRHGGSFCAAPVDVEGAPYCAEHRRLCWVKEKLGAHAAEPMFVARSARR
jgi:hypothetical protein